MSDERERLYLLAATAYTERHREEKRIKATPDEMAAAARVVATSHLLRAAVDAVADDIEASLRAYFQPTASGPAPPTPMTMAMLTRPQDWAEPARSILWPSTTRGRNRDR